MLELCNDRERDGAESELKLTGCENTNPSTEFEDGDEPTFLSGIRGSIAHSIHKGVHANNGL